MTSRISTRERPIATREKPVSVVGSKTSSSNSLSDYEGGSNDPSWYGGGGKEQKPKNSSWFGGTSNNIARILKEPADIAE